MKLLNILLVFCILWPSMQINLETYIVQVESPENKISTQSLSEDLESWYQSFLPNNIESSSSNEEPRLIYSYHNVMKGFAARLSAEEVKEMEKKPGFVYAWPERILSLHMHYTYSKLIGARTFPQANGSPIDDDGHGTHTASTAAGRFVEGANVNGNAYGTAVGIAPLAHLAIYKVCDSFGCCDSGILAAIDAAIADGS